MCVHFMYNKTAIILKNVFLCVIAILTGVLPLTYKIYVIIIQFS